MSAHYSLSLKETENDLNTALVPMTDVAQVQPTSALATMQPHPRTIRIGPSHHKYIYTMIAPNVYKCCRGSDDATGGQKLWLRYDGLQWIAFDGPDQDDVPPVGQGIFSSTENILVEGQHQWCMLAWDGRMSPFQTTVL